MKNKFLSILLVLSLTLSMASNFTTAMAAEITENQVKSMNAEMNHDLFFAGLPEGYTEEKSETPVVETNVANFRDADTEFSFSCANELPEGEWKVYTSADKSELSLEMSAVSSGSAIVLTSDVPIGIDSEFYAAITETGKAESDAVLLKVIAEPKYSINSWRSSSTNGLKCEETYPNGKEYYAGDEVLLRLVISADGEITKTGTFEFLVSTKGCTEMTSVDHYEIPIAVGGTVEDSVQDYTFIMPAERFSPLVNMKFILQKCETPIFESNSVTKTSDEQTSVVFKLANDFSDDFNCMAVLVSKKGYNSNDDRVELTRSGNEITMTASDAGAIETGDYKVVIFAEGYADSDFVILSVLPYVEKVAVVVSNKTNPDTSNDVEVVVNGKSQDAGQKKTQTLNGKKTTNILVDTDKLDKILEESGMEAEVIIPVDDKADVVSGTLTGQMIKNMESKKATLELETSVASYTIPAALINIDGVSERLGKNISLEDIDVEIKISEPSDQTVTVVEDAASEGNFTIMVPAVDFTITCNHDEQIVDVDLFNSYVSRRIAIPADVDHTKITTGIIVNPDGTKRSVPTKIVVIDGVYYAEINSLTNSTYTVVYNPINFDDIENNWAKDSINNMGSRMIVNGVGSNNYAPDNSISRAEVAVIVVRALGLEEGMGNQSFSDVTESDWFSSYVETAASYELIDGCGDGTFKPNDKITREQVMSIVARAMDKTELEHELSDEEISQILKEFDDSINISNYAEESVAACVKTGLVNGKSKTFLAPKDNISRAEVAVIIERLLKKSGLI